MKAILLAAGRGSRMHPLTQYTPKALLMLGTKPLIVHHIEKLAKIGITEIIINLAWHAHQIQAWLGQGKRWGVNLHYINEAQQYGYPLETASGIANSLPFFESQPFIAISADIYTTYSYAALLTLSTNSSGHILLTRNPKHHPKGDFAYRSDGHAQLLPDAQHPYTYSGIGIYHPHLFEHIQASQPSSLGQVLRQAVKNHTLLASLLPHNTLWCDVGTPQRLMALNHQIYHSS